MSASVDELARQGQALKAAGRMDEALALYRQAVERHPQSAVAEHNLGSALGDAGRWAEAEAHLRAAFTKGLNAPETWLVFARCLQTLGRFDEAEQAFRQTLRRRSIYPDAHLGLAQLRWMRTGDVDSALTDLDAALKAAPDNVDLISIKAQALRSAERFGDAFLFLLKAARAAPDNVRLLNAAAQAAQRAGQMDEAVRLAERAIALAPQEGTLLGTLATIYLEVGRTHEASEAAAAFVQRAPLDQGALALQATAWRLLGDPRHGALYDYEAFVYDAELATPSGWPNLPAYLADLAEMLIAEHRYSTHPFSQSILHGTQAVDILQLDHPAARALPEALDPPIRRYLDQLGTGADPLRSRNTGRYRFHGLWSIRQKAGGFHINHVHPQGWISSACYVQVPANTSNRAGWIKFGEPGSRTLPPLEAEHAVEPAPGKLVLFPSYMWHGTIPFTGDDTRLTFAFDLLPA